VHFDVIKSFIRPTNAQLNCFKIRIKIYIKIYNKCFYMFGFNYRAQCRVTLCLTLHGARYTQQQDWVNT